jgi:hypothetical protein
VTTVASDPGTDDAARRGAAFWVAMAVGAAITAYGAVGLWVDDGDDIGSIGRWFVGGALLADLVVVPAGAAVGFGLRRLSPAWLWPVLRAALLATVVAVVFALPLVLDQGGIPDNPSMRPRDYGTGLVAAVAWIWAVAAVVAALRWRTAGRSGARPDPTNR